jgi:glycosyltransferase involved in cell wall biosynthesis
MVCSQAPPVYGGAGTQALALATQLARRGCTVDLLTGNQLLAPRREVRGGVTIHRSFGERLARKLPKRSGEVLRTVLLLLWLALRFARRRYDVYHVHGNYWFALVPFICSRITRAPLVLKITRLDDDDAETAARKRAGAIPLGWLYAAPIRGASVVVAVNAEIERRHRARFPGVPVACLPNGVDMSQFAVTREARLRARKERGIPQDAAVALFVGHLTPRKGVTELLEAWFEYVNDELREAPVLLLVGPRSGFYRELSSGLSARVASEDARAAGVRCLSHLPPQAMPEIYAAADVFVLPTQSEGMPNSLLEALASGLPVVTSRVPGVTEILERDRRDSVIMDAPTPAQILSGLRATMRAERAEKASDRSPRIPPDFTVGRLADEYLKIYKTLSAGHHQSFDARAQTIEGLGVRW